jgi:hypothetical protein
MRAIGGVLLIIAGMAAGCTDKDRIPSSVLSREKMRDVLWDMIVADQYSSFLTRDSAHIHFKEERLRLYEQVFVLHGVSRDQFRKSYDYYLAHPDLEQALFDSLQSKGNRLRTEAYNHPSANPVIAAPLDTAHKATVHPPLTPMFGHPPAKPGNKMPGNKTSGNKQPVQ